MFVNYFCGVDDRLKSPAPQSQPPALFFPQLLVLQVPNILRLVVDRDRLNLGVV